MKSLSHGIHLAVELHCLVKNAPEYESAKKVRARVNFPDTAVRYVLLSPFCRCRGWNRKELANRYRIVFSFLRASTQSASEGSGLSIPKPSMDPKHVNILPASPEAGCACAREGQVCGGEKQLLQIRMSSWDPLALLPPWTSCRRVWHQLYSGQNLLQLSPPRCEVCKDSWNTCQV